LPELPQGVSLSTPFIMTKILTPFANFLIAAGIILGIITIVVSGIMYFMAGSDTKAEKAKGWFRNGIIGAFVILAVGVIILTIYNIVVTGSFFGGSGPGPGPVAPAPGLPWGSACKADSECRAGLACKSIGIFGTGGKTCQLP